MVVESQHTHARMVHGSRCMRDAHVLSALTECWRFVRLEKSENIIARYHDLTRVFLLILTFWFLPGSRAPFSFYMVAELVIWNNDVFNGEFPESPREREACEIQRWNTISPSMDAVD